LLATYNAQNDEPLASRASPIENVQAPTVSLENGVFKVCFFYQGLFCSDQASHNDTSATN
jgi:hypothetical protein